jgi:hypothetical protein
MSKTKVIELTEPIGAIKTIMLREPRCSDLTDLGMPATWVSLPGGGGFSQETPSVLGAWIERTVWQRPETWAALQLDYDMAQAMKHADRIKVRKVPLTPRI